MRRSATTTTMLFPNLVPVRCVCVLVASQSDRLMTNVVQRRRRCFHWADNNNNSNRRRFFFFFVSFDAKQKPGWLRDGGSSWR